MVVGSQRAQRAERRVAELLNSEAEGARVL